MKPAKRPPVSYVRRPLQTVRKYVMKRNEDLDDVLDRVFGEDAYLKTEFDASLPLVGCIQLPSGEECAVYKQGA